MRDDRRGYPLPDDPETDDVYCVSFQIPARDEYRLATTGAVYELAKWHNWERDPDQKARKATQLFKKLLYETFTIATCAEPPTPEECEELDYMQDGCVLLYSKDGGATWLIMFDYEQCFELLNGDNRANQIIINNETINNTNQLLDDWSQGKRPDDGAIDPLYWNIAICLATYSMIDALMGGLLQKRNQVNNTDWVGAVAGAMFTGIGIVDLIFKGITWKLTVPLAGLVGAWAGLQYLTRDEIANIPESEFSNLTLLDELRQTMYLAMKGIAPTLSSWEHALDGVAVVTPNALKFRDWLKTGLTLESFVNFLQIARILHDFAQAEQYTDNACEQLPTCPAISIVWINEGETPPRFYGFLGYGGQVYSHTRAPLTRWTANLPQGGNLILEYDMEPGCTLTGVNFSATRATGNSFSMRIQVQINSQPTWIEKAVRTNGTIGQENYLEWVNSNFDDVTRIKLIVSHISTFYITKTNISFGTT